MQKLINNLYRGLILSIDRKLSLVNKKTNNLLSKIDIVKLPINNGESFDSYIEEHNTICLRNTRVKLLSKITEWAKDRNSKPIFWLGGIAGTGKSTIARTVAQLFANNGQLGASFFFKKGEGNRGNATRFFTTIVLTWIEVSYHHLLPSVGLDRLYELCRRYRSAHDEKLYKMSHYLLSITWWTTTSLVYFPPT